MEKATPFYSTADWEALPRCWHCISIQSFHAGLELHSGHTEAEQSPWWNSPEQEFFLTAVLALTHTPLSSIPGQRHTGCFYVPVTPKVTVWHWCAMVFLCFSSPWACESPCGCLELLQTLKDAQLPWLCTFLPLWEALHLPEAAAPLAGAHVDIPPPLHPHLQAQQPSQPQHCCKFPHVEPIVCQLTPAWGPRAPAFSAIHPSQLLLKVSPSEFPHSYPQTKYLAHLD